MAAADGGGLEEAIRIACPSDKAAFQRYYESSAPLRGLPKAHLHIHCGAVYRNCDVKAALAAFNADPASLPKAREELERKAVADESQEDPDTRARRQVPLLAGGDKLRLPDIFWDEEGRLKPSGYDLKAFDAVCPWSGITGWNEADKLWHGMGGCRDYNLVANLIGLNKPGKHGDADWVARYVAASEDARAEGIRWVEYCGTGGHVVATPAKGGGLEITAEAWAAWRDPLVRGWKMVTDAVPEVGVALILVPQICPQYAAAFVERWREDATARDLIRGVGEVGAADTCDVEKGKAWKIFQAAGLKAVCVHVGEWPAEREAGVAESKARLSAAIDLRVSRIGHGILAHVDVSLLERLREEGICLEVCPTSNRVLDNVPGGLATHPLRKLFDAGVPCALASDDPSHLGSPNAHGLVREFLVARDVLGFSAKELAQLARNSFTHSLAPDAVKAAAAADIDRWLDAQSS